MDTSIEELKFDKKNFNKHTEYGMSLLEKSLRENGAGRSVLVDKDNNLIAGNGIVEAAINAGITKTKVIDVTGDELVVVRRTDLELDTKQGRKMALADNATTAADLSWDYEKLAEVTDEFSIDTADWGVLQPTIIDPDDFFMDDNKQGADDGSIYIAVVVPAEQKDAITEIKAAIKESVSQWAGCEVK